VPGITVAEFFATLPNLGGCWQSTRRKQHIKRQGFATCRRVLCQIATRSDLNARRSEKSIALRLRVLHTRATYADGWLGLSLRSPGEHSLSPSVRSFNPPPAKRGNWRRAKGRRSQAFYNRATPLRQPTQLAEGVEFLEEYPHFDHWEAPIGGRGRWPKMEFQFPFRSSAGPFSSCSIILFTR
jgi:hypothetical protein